MQRLANRGALQHVSASISRRSDRDSSEYRRSRQTHVGIDCVASYVVARTVRIAVVCDTCLELLDGDATQLQQDLLTWTPDQFAAAAAAEPGQQRRRPAPGQRRRQIHAP